MLRFILTIIAVLGFGASNASARQLTVVTWNLGWHMDIQTAKLWIDECNKKFVVNADGETWRPSPNDDGTPGWELNAYMIEGWDHSRFPVCSVFLDGDVVKVTPTAYQNRLDRLATYIEKSVPADIIAFQEVNGVQAIKEILPNQGSDFEFCEFDTPEKYKVQRLVIAWKKSLGSLVSCKTEESLSLQGNPVRFQPRPGLSVTLKIDGKLIRVLAVHLKSSCVSPLADGNLEGGSEDCKVLQQQVDPIEKWVESSASDDAKVILLGDFNRNFWHELRDQRPVRTDSSSPAGTRPAGVLSRSLLEEVADGVPPASHLTMVKEECSISEIGRIVCAYGEIRPLNAGERALLGSGDYLGCRNPVGLDHILVGPGFDAKNTVARHISIGFEGYTRAGDEAGNRQKLAISDHCPMVIRMVF